MTLSHSTRTLTHPTPDFRQAAKPASSPQGQPRSAGERADHDQVEIEQVGIGGSGDHEVAEGGEEGVGIVLRETFGGVKASRAGAGNALAVRDRPGSVGGTVGAVGAGGEEEDVVFAVNGQRRRGANSWQR